MNKIVFGNSKKVLDLMPDGKVNLIYIDPPFNTGKARVHTQVTTKSDKGGDRIGFGGKKYKTSRGVTMAFADKFDDFVEFIEPMLQRAYEILADDGSLFFHIDYREVHYCKILLDNIFGRNCFMNEIIWHYDYGAKSKKRWSVKHQNILWYVKDPNNYTFNHDAIDRIPYLAPDLVTKEKAERGKIPTDTWWHTIVGTNSKEKTGYPTQKPIGVINRIINVHSNEGDLVMDFFAGSGTLGESAARKGRNYIMVDKNPNALKVMKKRLKFSNPEIINISKGDLLVMNW